MDKYPEISKIEFDNLIARVKSKLTGQFLPKRMVVDDYKYSFFLCDELWRWDISTDKYYSFLKALVSIKKKLYLYISKPLPVKGDDGALIDVPLMIFDEETLASTTLMSYLGFGDHRFNISEVIVVSEDLDLIFISSLEFWETCVCYFKDKELFDFAVDEMANWITDLYDLSSPATAMISHHLEFAKTHWDEFPFLPENEKQIFLNKINSGTGRIRNPWYD